LHVFTINRTAFGQVRRADIPSDHRRLPWRSSARTPISCTSNGALPRWRAGAETSYCACTTRSSATARCSARSSASARRIADYFGQVDWKSFGLAPLTALALGALIVGFRAITSTPLGSRKA
jgi:hypothetical protein